MSCAEPNAILFININLPGRPDIQAIQCRDGKIEQLLSSHNGISGKVIDLKGGWIYPGLTDAHMHLTGLGWSMESVNLVGTPTKEAALEKIKIAAETTPEGTWIQGRGWDQNDWPVIEYPNKEDLDEISTTHPIVLNRIDGHASWVNSKAMDLSGVSKKTNNVDGGIILRDDFGNPTGIFIDHAMDLISSKIPAATEDDIQRRIIKAQTLLNKLGITSVHDAGTSKKEIAVMKDMIAKGELTVRVYTMLHNNPADYESFLESGPETDNPFIKVSAVKIYLDGALGSRGAALLKPYADAENHDGLMLISPEEHEALVTTFTHAGFQCNTHGIGDRAVRTILDSYESSANPELRNRIEHAQIVHQDDIPRFKQLGVIPAMQATHCTSDMYWADERLGEDRLHEAYPWQSMIQTGVVVPGGSDAPVEFPDPLVGIYASVTRQDAEGWPQGGWQPEEKMMLDQAILSYTEWAAYAAFEEHEKGKVEKGFYADFTVLDQKLSAENPTDILKTKVLMTIVDGEIVYRHDQ